MNKLSPLQMIRQAASDCIISHVVNDHGLTESDVKVLVNYDHANDGWKIIARCKYQYKEMISRAIDNCWVLGHLTGPKFIEWKEV